MKTFIESYLDLFLLKCFSRNSIVKQYRYYIVWIDIPYNMEKENSPNRVEQMKKVQQEGLELFIQKNKDYGDAFAKYGVVGVLMRMEDKLQRGISITKNGVHLVSQEGMRDTLIDLHNYAAMALMLLDE
jgi:hypothetical protein